MARGRVVRLIGLIFRGLIFRGLILWGLISWVSFAAHAAELEDWPLYGGNHANHRYSPLEQIHRRNVAELELAWRFDTGRVGSFQATPIVIDGIMYLSTPFNDVVALDAASGELKWRYRHTPTKTRTCCGPANRGVAVAHGRVYMVTIDARFIALDQADGKLLWDHPITDPDSGRREVFEPLTGEAKLRGAKVVGGTGFSANMAPQVYGDLVFAGTTGAGYGLHLDVDEQGESVLSVVGLSGGEHGLRGFLVAYDAHTGSERWRWYPVSGPDWTGEWRQATPDGVPLNRDIAAERSVAHTYPETWRLGGGSIWTTPAVDPALGLLFVGTGNPAPQMDDSTRPGDNLHTVSLVALEMDSGKMVWSYQQVPHDRWGYDVASPPVLLTVERDGHGIPAVAQASKTGWVYVHERRNGELLFKSAPFVPQRNLFQPPTARGVTISPGIFGGASWSPMAYHPGMGAVFVAAIHHPTTYFTKSLDPMPGRPWRSYTFTKPSIDERWGTLSAVDLASGELRWQHKTPLPLVGGVLSTASGLVFTGQGDGKFSAFDAASGKTLWQATVEFGVNAPPITYSVDGVQYVAVAAGGNKLFRFETGDAVLAFRLPGHRSPTASSADRQQGP